MAEIRWDLLNPVDVGAQVQQGFATGLAMVKKVQTNNALKAYMAAPDDPRAYGALAQFDPQAASSIRQDREQQIRSQLLAQEQARAKEAEALKARQQNLVLGAEFVKQFKPQNDEQWQATLQAAHNAGVDISTAPPNFDPQWTQNLLNTAASLAPEKETAAPASIREYEYAKNQGYTGSYMDFQATNAPPFVVDNNDGTKTIYPRGAFGAAPKPMGAPQSTVANVLSGSGLPPSVIAGALGNFEVEDGYTGNKGDGGKAHGIAQWHPDRLANYTSAVGRPFNPADHEGQARFFLWEMQNPEKAGMTVAERDAILNAPTPGAAAALIDQHYERSSGQHRDRRIAAANQFAGLTPPKRVSSKAEVDALPSGAEFIAPDGSLRRKP